MLPIHSFISAANSPKSIWRFVFGLGLIVLIWGLLLFPISLAFLVAYVAITGDDSAAIESASSIETVGPVGTMIILAGFAGIWAGVYFAGRRVLRQPFGAFFAPAPHLRLGAFIKGAALGLFYIAMATAPGLIMFDSFQTGLAPATLLPFLAPLIVLIFIQVTAEELVFRGYLLQQLGAWSQHWLVWAGLPSLAFGLLHFNPDLPDGSGYYYVVSATLMGLAFCAVVWRSGTLWAAIGLHLTINVFSLTVIGMEGIMSGTQIWVVGKSDLAISMQMDIVTISALLVLILSPAGRLLGPGSGHKPEQAANIAP